jgi:hypothetical protein
VTKSWLYVIICNKVENFFLTTKYFLHFNTAPTNEYLKQLKIPIILLIFFQGQQDVMNLCSKAIKLFLNWRIIIWRARTRFSLEQAWFLEVGSNDRGIGELSLHFKIKINVGFIISWGALSEKFGIYVHQSTIFRGY